MISLVQRAVWNQEYKPEDQHLAVNVNGLIKDVLSVLQEASAVGEYSQAVYILSMALGYALRDQPERTFSLLTGNLINQNSENQHVLDLVTFTSIFRPKISKALD